MAEPMLTPENPATIDAAGTATQGLMDPNFTKALDAAFAQVQADKAGKSAPKSAEPPTQTAPAAKAEPAKAPELTEPAETYDPSEPKTSSQKQGWKELKRQKAEAEEAAQRYQSKVKELESKLSRYNDDEIGRVKKERDDFEARLKSFAVEHDPQFNQEWEQGRNRITREAQAMLGDQASRFLSLLALPEGEFKRQQIAAMTENMDEFGKDDIKALVRDHRKLALERQEKIENARNNYDKILALERERQQQAQNTFMQKFDSTLRDWQDPERGIAPLQIKDGDESHNGMVRDAVQRARDLFTGKLTPDEQIKAALWSAISPNLLTNLNSVQAENAKLRDEIKSLKAVQPGLEDASGGGEMPEDPALKNMSYAERIAYIATKAGAFDGR